MMIVSKNKGKKFDQKMYDDLFYNIENNLRELGFGDVSVNKKMKEFNQILYDILLKINDDKDNKKNFTISHKLVSKYFNQLKDPKSPEYINFKTYFVEFYNFCFELSLQNMVRDAVKYKG